MGRLAYCKQDANFVGKSSVSVAGNSSNTSLELSPWTPSYVNNGHECLIAAVVEGDASPPTILDGNNDPTVAQHNLGVVNLGGQMEGHFSYPFQVCNPSRIEQRFTIYAEKAPVELATPFLPSLRERTDKASKRPEERVLKLGFVDEVCPPAHSIDHAKPVLEDVRLAPLACTGFTLVGVLEMGEALTHVNQWIGDKLVGGLSF
jgi:hypothetical protein